MSLMASPLFNINDFRSKSLNLILTLTHLLFFSTSTCISLRPHKRLAAVVLKRWAVMRNIVPMATFVAYFIIPADIGGVPSANFL